MGKGGNASIVAEHAKGENPTFFGVLCRVVSDFANPAAENRGDYYKANVIAQEAIRNRKDRPEIGGNAQYTRAEVEKHADVADCWIIVKGKVYDITEFAPQHPGGRVIYTYAGKDATDVFTAFHAGSSWGRLAECCIGQLTAADTAQPVDPIVADFRALRTNMALEGMFKSSKAFYVYKALSTFSICLAAYAVLALWGSTWTGYVASAFLLGLFWQQCGWLAHDFCHNQVFQDRRLNAWGGQLVGGVWAGFSVDWWKGKHNTHHAAPNEVTAGGMPVDPDVDTLPMIAWSPELLSTVQDAAYRSFIRLQHYLFFPLLCFARMSWAQQSAAHPGDSAKHTANAEPMVEKFCLGIHYAWLVAFAFSQLSPLAAVSYLVLSQMMSGFMLSLVFVQSHNGMEIYSDAKDFFMAQMVSTRDILGTPFNDWFTGGLNYQIEHHLYPTLPRHNLKKSQRYVMEVCAKHGIKYENCSMVDGTLKVLKALADIAALA